MDETARTDEQPTQPSNPDQSTTHMPNSSKARPQFAVQRMTYHPPAPSLAAVYAMRDLAMTSIYERLRPLVVAVQAAIFTEGARVNESYVVADDTQLFAVLHGRRRCDGAEEAISIYIPLAVLENASAETLQSFVSVNATAPEALYE